MRLDPEERILLTADELERINKICNDPPTITEHMRQHINGIKKDETKNQQGS